MARTFSRWSENLSVGNAVLDDQHKQLLSLCEKAAGLLEHKGDNKKEHFHAVLNDLFAASSLHFKTEEDLLRKHEYPNFEEHKKAHQLHMEQLTEILINATHGETNAEKLYKVLHDWLDEHETETDVQYKEYLSNH
jgi:hemerythrin